MKNKTNGITLISLVITIIILTILAGISIYSGKETIKKAKLEELKTNMLLIQAKARQYVEEANFKIGIGTEEEKNAKTATVRKEIYEDTEKLRPARRGSRKFRDNRYQFLLLLNSRNEGKMGTRKITKRRTISNSI